MISSHFVSTEIAREPAQILLGVTSFGPESEAVQADWRDGTLAEYALVPASVVTPADGFDDYDSAELSVLNRCAVTFGGLLRGRLAVGETLVVTGATGAYGSAAVLIGLAMGASHVVAAGRNKETLDAVARAAGQNVSPVLLTGDAASDAESMRKASGGGGDLAFDMVGQAKDPNATLAALGSLRRGGRLVLMGSMTTVLPVSYMQLMFNNLEVIGNFMHPRDANFRLLQLLRSGRLNINPIVPKLFPLSSLPEAMQAATDAKSLECVVVQS
jgi:alcohol dehydrogenase